MRKSSVLAAVPLFLFLSCSRAQKKTQSEKITLKNSLAEISSAVEWTDEIEPGVFEKEIPVPENASKNVKKTPLVMAASFASPFYKKIYPSSGENFSYDLGGIESDCVAALEKFLVRAEENEFDETVIDAENFYTYVLFLYDAEKILGGKKIFSAEIARPFEGEGFYEFPVRFFTEENFRGVYTELCFYMKKKEGGWKIVQIEFKRT